MTTINFKGWSRHFKKDPRSTEMVMMPRDVFDFILETNEAYVSMEDETGTPTIVACQLLALELLQEVAAHNRPPVGDI
jgi:hypothetical protein